MFERFTKRARRVLVLAQDEAKALEHDFIGTEHLLLGLVREGEGIGAVALAGLGVDFDTLRDRIAAVVTPGTPGTACDKPPFTPRAKKVLELSLREALDLNHNYIGTEHLILGLVREGEGVAAHVLGELELTPGAIRAKVLELLSGYTAPAPTVGAEPDRLTPAAVQLRNRASAAAAGEPIGSHHHLLGLLDDPSSLGAKVLESFGVTREAVVGRVAELGAAGTSDEIPKPASKPATYPLAPGLALTVEDPALVEDLARWLTGRGDEGGVLAEWLAERLVTAPEPDPEEGPDGS